jgi:GT2 family glycosyltransferase
MSPPNTSTRPDRSTPARPSVASLIAAGWRVLRRHLGQVGRDPRRLAWLLGRSWRILRSGELAGVLARHRREVDLDGDYLAWIAACEPGPNELDRWQRQQASWRRRPRISIVMPVYDPEPALLRCAIDSILAQTYTEWELLLVDDGSRRDGTAELLEDIARHDPRIILRRLAVNGGIVKASNAGIDAATGSYVAFVDQDDTLAAFALDRIAATTVARPAVQFLYSDEDRIDTAGRRSRPLFKPGWNPELLRATNCVLHLAVVETTLLRRLGGFRVGTDGAQDWDLAMRIAETVPREGIAHVPQVLYHWRVHPGSTAAGPYAKPGQADRVREIAVAGLARRGEQAVVEQATGGLHYRFALPLPRPRVSIVIPTRDRIDLVERCVASIERAQRYPECELVIVDNGSRDAAALRWLARFRAERRGVVVRDDRPFNYAALCNMGVRAAGGELIVLLNNDVEVVSADWLEELAGLACRPGVGLVGAMLYYPDDTIQHAGVILGLNGVADRPHVGERRGYRGIDGNAGYVQEIGAVITACAAILRSRYDEAGGMEERLPVSCNDVDLCLRLRARGYAILWTPFAELYHRESVSRGYANTAAAAAREAEEQRWLADRWPNALVDPYYNPNFARSGRAYSLAMCANGQSITTLRRISAADLPDAEPDA